MTDDAVLGTGATGDPNKPALTDQEFEAEEAPPAPTPPPAFDPPPPPAPPTDGAGA